MTRSAVVAAIAALMLGLGPADQADAAHKRSCANTQIALNEAGYMYGGRADGDVSHRRACRDMKVGARYVFHGLRRHRGWRCGSEGDLLVCRKSGASFSFLPFLLYEETLALTSAAPR